MADLSAVINSAGSAFPTTQVFDVYLLAIENIPAGRYSWTRSSRSSSR